MREVAPAVDPTMAAVVTAMLEATAESAARTWSAAEEPLERAVLTELVTTFAIGGLGSLAAMLGLDIELDG
jgi:hypothetical protein